MAGTGKTDTYSVLNNRNKDAANMQARAAATEAQRVSNNRPVDPAKFKQWANEQKTQWLAARNVSSPKQLTPEQLAHFNNFNGTLAHHYESVNVKQVGPLTPGQTSQPSYNKDTVTTGLTPTVNVPNANGQLLRPDFQMAGEYAGAPTLNTPQYAATTQGMGKNGFTAGQVLNLARDSSNLTNRVETERVQQGIGQLNQGQERVRGLYDQANGSLASNYGHALDQYDQMGQQANRRIDLTQQNATSQAYNDLASRGLDNSSTRVTSTQGIARNAEDARLGVQNSIAQGKSGIYTGLGGAQANLLQGRAATETGNSGNIANMLTGQQFSDPLNQAFGDVTQPYKQKSNAGAQIMGGIGGAAAGALIAALI